VARLGVRAGDRVGLAGANHPGQLVLLFALARIGAILLPLNFRLFARRMGRAPGRLRARASGARRCLGRCGAGAWARRGLAVHPVETLARQGHGPSPPRAARRRSPVLLVYTSGTTSRAKAAVHTQANLLANMAIASRAQQMTAQDVIATMLPLFHVGGLCIQTLPALYVGAHVILHPRFAATRRSTASSATARP
jgi:fatty-acyl-CoA synthase